MCIRSLVLIRALSYTEGLSLEYELTTWLERVVGGSPPMDTEKFACGFICTSDIEVFTLK